MDTHAIKACLFTLVIGFVFFLARKSRRPMRYSEEVLSTTWLIFRRIVAFGFGFLLILGAFRNIYLAFVVQEFRYAVYAIFCFGIAFLSYFFGRYGKVGKYSTVAQDVGTHNKRAKKHGWHW